MAKTMKIKMTGVVEANSFGNISVDGHKLQDYIAINMGLADSTGDKDAPYRECRFAGSVTLEVVDLGEAPQYSGGFAPPESKNEVDW